MSANPLEAVNITPVWFCDIRNVQQGSIVDCGKTNFLLYVGFAVALDQTACNKALPTYHIDHWHL